VVPAPVYAEVKAKASDDAAKLVASASWVVHVPAPAVPADIARWDLGAGESAVLAWAQAHSGSVAILDDARARQLAQGLRLPLIGTLGIVVRAKRQGRIPLVRPIVESLIAHGMYLSSLLVKDALAVVGE